MDKAIIIVDPRYSAPVLLNAVGHLSLGLGQRATNRAFAFRNFHDPQGQDIACAMDHPLIVMRAKKSIHLKRCLEAALSKDLPVNVFLETMRHGTPEEQVLAIKSRDVAGEDIIAVGLAGQSDKLREVTKRFSLLDQLIV